MKKENVPIQNVLNCRVILEKLSNPKQPSCKKKCAALKKVMVKKDVKTKVAAKKWL